MAFEELLKRLEPAEQAVFDVLEEIGPACDRRILDALNQKEAKARKPANQRRYWEINSVCGRRNGLINLGVVRDMGIYVGQWYGKKKKYHFWKVAGDIREPVGWKKYEKKIQRKYKPNECQTTAMDVHQAGRVMVEWRRQGRRRINQPTKQLVMF